MMKGLIYYENADIAEQPCILSSNRPVVVVSANPGGSVVQVVPLTTSEKWLEDGLPYHVAVNVNGRQSVALCEQLRTVRQSDLRRFPMATCSLDERRKIDVALRSLLGLSL